MPEQYGIIGKPLGHSFSPDYFAERFRKNGIDARYDRYELNAADELPELITKHQNIKGLNITIPFKESVLPFLKSISPEAQAIGAVNTIKVVEGELYGFNTDVVGFDETWEGLGLGKVKALVLGTGGSSKAVRFILERRGISFLEVSRTPEPRQLSYRDLSKGLFDEFSVIINTTPLGMTPQLETKPNLPYRYVSDQHVLIDLIYNPRVTAFLHEGLRRGSRIKNGFEMLVQQAEASWKIWNSDI